VKYHLEEMREKPCQTWVWSGLREGAAAAFDRDIIVARPHRAGVFATALVGLEMALCGISSGARDEDFRQAIKAGMISVGVNSEVIS
jgi:hypothetical protein